VSVQRDDDFFLNHGNAVMMPSLTLATLGLDDAQ